MENDFAVALLKIFFQVSYNGMAYKVFGDYMNQLQLAVLLYQDDKGVLGWVCIVEHSSPMAIK